MKKKVLDSWKRPIEIEVTEDPSEKYPQQLQFTFGPREATPDEFNEWQEKELSWWGERQLVFVAIASLVQLSALGFMGIMMMLIGVGFK